MKRFIGLIISIALLIGILAGCAGVPNSPSPVTKASQPEENDLETEKWPRTYADVLGREIVLEKKPERVALLFFRNFEHLFLLDESPIAATDMNVLDEWVSLAPYKDNDIADLGSITNPNVEINPDLIIMVSSRFGDYGEKLEKIAPVITVDSNENNWQGAIRDYGKIFGKEQKAEDEIARIEALIADSREKLKEYGDKTFGVIMLGDKQFWAFTTQFVFNKENGLGLQPPSKMWTCQQKGSRFR
ncbi:ABC transporter substrate-binding protein [Brevibacillus humidisoli]|uniref:ABC transporter substrate-binding protein n=1 Tax=Brevibacillus humidisoli TaxID=2895522 RepID=UPI002104F42E|nr:ABC transporter substrate-binding protein [Brevibacillus humidisoli]